MATSSLPITVVTDDPAGYSLSVQAASAPALRSASSSFADYAPAANPAADYSFSVPSGASAFGFSVSGSDAVSRYKNNGSACGAGGTSTAFACWDGFSTSPATVAQASGPNSPGGSQTVIGFGAGIGPSKLQDAGAYAAHGRELRDLFGILDAGFDLDAI